MMNIDKQLKILLMPLLIGAMIMLTAYHVTGAQDHADKTFAWARMRSGHPAFIRFRGTFFAPDEVPDEIRKSQVFKVLVAGEKEWAFHIEQARNLSWVESEHKLLGDIWPRSLYFIGREEVLNQLRNPDISGRSLIVLGYFYRNARNFQVTEVQDPSRE